MKKILSLFAAVLFAGSMFAVDAEILKGETNSYDDVTINGQPAIKMGKSSAGGDMYINLGAGAKILTLHVVAWNKEGGAKVFIDTPEGITADPAELELVANENIAGSGKDFTLEDEDAYKFQIALSGVEAPCTLTLRSEKRAIVWAASYETDGEIIPPAKDPEYPIADTWFADPNWQQETESSAVYDEAGEKITVTIAVDKASQWQGQLKIQGPKAVTGNSYRVALKMKANNNVGGITLKWQDDNNDPNVIYENQSINLEAGVEFAFDREVEGIAGNGILVLDFGWAKAGDVIEIYDIIFEITALAPLPDPTNCAEAAEAALTVEKNNDPYNGGKEYTIRGYVTEIATEYNEQYGNISFWMADEVDGGQVLEAFRCTPEAADKLPEVGDLVEVTGVLTKYGTTPEFAQGCTCVILQKQGVENTSANVKAVKVIRNGQVLIMKGDKTFNVLGTEMK